MPDLPPGASVALRLAARAKAVAMVATSIDLPGKWRADTVYTQTHTRKREVTSHPVENGFRISDHSRQLPVTLAFRGVVSDTPVDLFSGLISQVSLATLRSRSLEAKAKLDAWFAAGEPLYCATSIGVYPSMILESYAITRDEASGGAIEFDLSLTEIRIASEVLANALVD
ncbi:MAG TPA: hypothetical protein VII92_08540, partial [Anaerolineae bacterium]